MFELKISAQNRVYDDPFVHIRWKKLFIHRFFTEYSLDRELSKILCKSWHLRCLRYWWKEFCSARFVLECKTLLRFFMSIQFCFNDFILTQANVKQLLWCELIERLQQTSSSFEKDVSLLCFLRTTCGIQINNQKKWLWHFNRDMKLIQTNLQKKTIKKFIHFDFAPFVTSSYSEVSKIVTFPVLLNKIWINSIFSNISTSALRQSDLRFCVVTFLCKL